MNCPSLDPAWEDPKGEHQQLLVSIVMEWNLFCFFPNNLYVIILPGYNLQLALSDFLSFFLEKKRRGLVWWVEVRVTLCRSFRELK